MPYDTIDEAIEIANDSRYALGASVFGPDKYECLDVAKKLECGMVSINDFGVFYVRAFLRVELPKKSLTRPTAEVCLTTVDTYCIVFIPDLLSTVKISLLEEQSPVATEDSVSVVTLTFMFSS
jgi:hypothetical protein